MRENMQIFSAQCRVGKKCPLFSVFARLFHFLRGLHKVYGKKRTLIFFLPNARKLELIILFSLIQSFHLQFQILSLRIQMLAGNSLNSCSLCHS